ncbi:MAG: hypothetical protein IAF94_12825 [Pirellulaceae bacterium]|nr:hypothetical protein [Pirellulaceae bacterium]
MKITLADGPVSTFILKAPDGRSILIQTDYDFPGVASTFGWQPCICGATDGTTDCPHRTVAEMIAEAREFLASTIGEPADDPGYF